MNLIVKTFVSDPERLNALKIRIAENGLACNYYKVASGYVVNIYSIGA